MICFDQLLNVLTDKHGKGFRASDRRSSHFPSTHIKINACISLQASVPEAEAGDGNGGEEPLSPLDRMGNKNIRQDAPTVTQTRSPAHSKTHVTHAHRNKPHTPPPPPKNKQKHEAVQTHSHTLAFPVPSRPTRKVKKETQK